VGRPAFHGRTFHLTATEPVPVGEIKTVAERELGIDGVELAGPGPLAEPSELEQAFQDGLREYWPYLEGDPVFDRRNTCAALSDLPAPRIDRQRLERLIRFGNSDSWGHRRQGASKSANVDCAGYIERDFPIAVQNSFLARMSITATLGFEIHGPSGGRWLCRLGQGRVLDVCRGSLERAQVVYQMDVVTFAAIVAGRESPQAAFGARRIEIIGDLETGLKLAVLFGRFVRETPYRPEVRHAVAC
jgi:hypothetical protein